MFFHHDHPPEKLMEDTNDIIVGSNSMPYQDYLKACGWKWYMMAVHFLGWLRILAIDLKNIIIFPIEIFTIIYLIGL